MTRPLHRLSFTNRACRGRRCGIEPACGAADEWRTTSSLIGESKYGEDFEHYDYVNPDAPKGGTLNSVATGTFDSFNPYIVRGTPGRRLRRIRRRPALRHADGAGDRRAERQPSADRRRLQISGRFFLGDLPARSARQMARRQADHRRRRDLVVQRAEGQQPDVQPLLRQRDRGGGDFRPRGRVPFRPEGQSRTAADHRRPRRAAEALVGRHRRHRQEARHHAADAGAAARLGRLQDRELQARARRSSGRASRTIGRPNCR